MKTDHIIDTCCLINILASGRTTEILTPSQAFYIGERASKESLYLNEYNEENAQRTGKTAVDLTPLFANHSLVLCKLETEEEYERYLFFAERLDDGEAEALALGFSRNWTVATDDKKAVRIAGEHGIKTTSTLQIVMHWAKKNRIGKKEFREVMTMIQQLASFVPSPNSPGYDEWVRYYQ